MHLFNPKLVKLLAMFCGAFVTSSVHAELILNYESLLPSSGGSRTLLACVESQTDKSLVQSSEQLCRLGSDVAGGYIRDGFEDQVGGAFSNQEDIQFRFGSEPIGSRREYALSNRAVTASNLTGNYIEFIFTAADKIELEEVSFRMFVNSENVKTHGARDVAVFIDVERRGFRQFGNMLDGKNADNGVVVFTATETADKGEKVTVRLVFADKTNLKQNLQAATRIGDVQIHAKKSQYAKIPESSIFTLTVGVASFLFIASRRRKNGL